MIEPEQPDEEPEGYPQPQPQQPEQPRMPFSREDLINAELLRTTEFGVYLKQMISEANIYQEAKRAMNIVASNYISKVWFLANLEKGGKGSATFSDEILAAKISIEKDLTMATASFCVSDIQSSDLMNIQNALMSHFKPILSRAKGVNRERVLNSKFTLKNEQEITQRIETVPVQPQQQPQKKSFWNRG